ncbi:hypothetical protein BH23ACT10_BH23ACT10_14750 [soil metagenome]
MLALLAALTTGCTQLAQSASTDVKRGQVSLRPLLDSDALAIPGAGPDDVTAVLGEPTSSEVAEKSDDEPDGTVTTMRYDGLEVVVHEIDKPKRSFISDLVISNRAYVPSLPVTVGISRRDVEQVLGEPPETEDGDVAYDLSDDGDLCIVTYDGNKVAQVAFRFS